MSEKKLGISSTLHSVAVQILISASNFALYFMLASKLNDSDFILFSGAVSISIMAYAIAESGISYIAPKILSKNKLIRGVINTSFICISVAMYSSLSIVFYIIWNLVIEVQVQFIWIFSYFLYFLPVMLIPSWSTCWYVNLADLIQISLARMAILVCIFINPSVESIYLSSGIYLLFILFFLQRINGRLAMFRMPKVKHIVFVLAKLKQVFFAKTTTYFIYSAIPFFVSATFGAYASAMYLLGERLKATFSTLFYPIIQAIYLWQFTSKPNTFQINKLMTYLIILNISVALLLIFLVNDAQYMKKWLLSGRLNDLELIEVYIGAAFVSVLSSSILFFKVLPQGLYDVFKKGVYFQALVFLILFGLILFSFHIDPAYILFVGEIALFLFLFLFLFFGEYSTRKS